MFAFFLIVFIVPLVFAGGAFLFSRHVSTKKLLLIAAATLVVAGVAASVVSCANTYDVEVWNGVVTNKQQVTVSCSHSYQCHCHQECSGGKNNSCSEHCDTCYEHAHDYDWDVYTSNGETITIDRVDRQGADEPRRFTAVRQGEPTAQTHSFTNYVKASPGSLFRHQGLKEKYLGQIPGYPQEIYDYYRLNRLVALGVNVDGPGAWNDDLAGINAALGRSKQVNVIVVLVSNRPHDWYYALEESWIGGKKNDAVLVVSVDDQMKPQWAEVMAWTTNELFKVKLRDAVMDQQLLERSSLMSALSGNIRQYYVRKPMKDFEYLSSQITPSTTEWVVTLLAAILVAGFLAYVCHVKDIFGEENRWRYS